jgi:hypothetical protein
MGCALEVFIYDIADSVRGWPVGKGISSGVNYDAGVGGTCEGVGIGVGHGDSGVYVVF